MSSTALRCSFLSKRTRGQVSDRVKKTKKMLVSYPSVLLNQTKDWKLLFDTLWLPKKEAISQELCGIGLSSWVPSPGTISILLKY